MLVHGNGCGEERVLLPEPPLTVKPGLLVHYGTNTLKVVHIFLGHVLYFSVQFPHVQSYSMGSPHSYSTLAFL